MDRRLKNGGNPPVFKSCASWFFLTDAHWRKIRATIGQRAEPRLPSSENRRKWRKTVASVENRNWRRTGATGAAKGLCASHREPPKGGFPNDKWRTPLAPKLTGARSRASVADRALTGADYRQSGSLTNTGGEE